MAESAIGLVLAAGSSTRYGSPKVLAHGGDWLAAAVEALVAGGCESVIVVLGAADAPMPTHAQSVHAPDWSAGMSASLRAGLDAARAGSDASYAVVHVVDTPDVGPDVVRAVLSAARESASGLARAVFDASPGHPVVFARRHWAAVVAGSSGDAGAREFLRDRSDVARVECSAWATGVDHDFP